MSESNTAESSTAKKIPPHVRKLDLSVINNPLSMTGMAAAPQNQINVVLELPLEDVMEDPHQPRTQFDEETLNSLASDIKTRGVQQPITVRPKNAENKHVIIQGARRYRASKLAGITTIPAIVQKDQDKFNDYAQVTENTQRENLSALDLAAFMQKRKEAGDSTKTIAENLGERQETITQHLTLVSADTPDILKEAFQSGKINGIRAFYDLLQLWKSDPALAENLLAEDTEITQKTVRMAKRQSQAPENRAKPTAPTEEKEDKDGEDMPARTKNRTETEDEDKDKTEDSANTSAATTSPYADDQHQETSDGSNGEGELEHDHEGEGGNEEGADADTDAADPEADPDATPPETQRLPYHNPALDKPEPTPHDPGKIKKPLLLGTHQDRNIKVLLNRTPSAVGFIHIQYEDTMELSEALMREIQLTMLSEMKVREVS